MACSGDMYATVPMAVPGLVRYSRLTPVVTSVWPAGDRRIGRARGNFCQAEVENLGVSALGDENVGGLDVAMDNAFAVRGVERVGDFDGQAEQDIHFERTAGDAVLQGQAIQILHGDEGLAILFADVVNGADVGMVERGSRLGLAAKALERLAVLGHIFGEKLQGDEAIEASVFGFVNDTHAATTQLFDDAVVRDGLADHLWAIVRADVDATLAPHLRRTTGASQREEGEEGMEPLRGGWPPFDNVCAHDRC